MTLFGASVKAVKHADKKGVENQILGSLIPLLLYSQDDIDAIAEVMSAVTFFQPHIATYPGPAVHISIHILEDQDFVVPS